ncbi:hypothetical protein JQ615_37805 [Bradyrhizobium jicamae]|uniref:RDD domain-containing protein n=1 Tax=Bradyrhizobium jicamae TaxID=280332 RepID=A0ABS5FWK1_9BRAD|nr:hypothetical protein [Bradyrhizobium jicamae]MBR0801128.1 hypothetical protein [Bradyrhizobium jicamae]
MRPDIVSQKNLSRAEKARWARLIVVCDPLGCFAIIFTLGAGAFRLFGHSLKAGYIVGLAAFLCWVLFTVLTLQRELEPDIKALDHPGDDPRADRLIASRREHGSSGAIAELGKKVLRFIIEFLKAIAIIIALPLGIGFVAEVVMFALSDRDVSGAFGSGLAGIAGGILGLVIAIVIVLRRIADIED